MCQQSKNWTKGTYLLTPTRSDRPVLTLSSVKSESNRPPVTLSRAPTFEISGILSTACSVGIVYTTRQVWRNSRSIWRISTCLSYRMSRSS